MNKSLIIKDKLRILRKELSAPKGNFVDIIIERGAFGSGEHETTISCLEELLNLDVKDKNVLDIGCGTGILAIAALKLGAKRATGIDIAREAIETAKLNASLNEVENKLDLILGTITKVKGKFDVILANIYPEVLKDIVSHIKRVSSEGTILIVSGIPWDENSEILRLYKSHGFQVINNRFLEYYTTAVLRFTR